LGNPRSLARDEEMGGGGDGFYRERQKPEMALPSLFSPKNSFSPAKMFSPNLNQDVKYLRSSME
jgi:hypothetical protein